MMRKPREWPGISAKAGEHVMEVAWDGQVTLGALPMGLFMNGHGYFVQRAHHKLKVPHPRPRCAARAPAP